MSNRLKDEKSPYLLQHKDNPVDWYPWCEEAFETARNEDKPIFLSVGYSTCHWCHVMAHESFEDNAVARVLEDFVCIKVDKEERPDIDAVYMSVCQALTGAGGWPLTVFLTPEKKPFFAGTYFPKNTRGGQMGLVTLLQRTAHLWRTEKEKLFDAGDRITEVIGKERPAEKGVPTKKLLEDAYRLFCESFDREWGGFGGAPKFPSAHQLLFLMRYAREENQPDALHMAEKTLQSMACGGLYDVVGGGFCRYSTDRIWLAPHFEKTLYDNALLLSAYAEAFQVTGNALYADVARRTADYTLRELTGESGGFCCGQDADSDGVEGKYYVFTPEEILRVLGPETGVAFCRKYNVTNSGNFEGKSILNRIGQTESEKADTPALQKLYDYRKTRAHLHRDDKILLSWNALAIAALAQSSRILDEKRYLAAALEARRFIEETMTDRDGRLLHRFRDGEAALTGQLDDYAAYAFALLELYDVTYNADYLLRAVQISKQMSERFEDKNAGGYYINAHDAEQLIARPKEVYDGAMPSGNSLAALVMSRLADLTGEVSLQEAADRQLRFMAGQIAAYPAGHSFALLSMADVLYPRRDLIGTGREVPPELTEYRKAHPADGLRILFKSAENEKALSEAAPFTAAYPLPETGTLWYLCVHNADKTGACQAPVEDFGALNLP